MWMWCPLDVWQMVHSIGSRKMSGRKWWPYMQVDYDEVWKVATVDFPALERQLVAIRQYFPTPEDAQSTTSFK
jgi:uncharacterized protein with HEPN domain